VKPEIHSREYERFSNADQEILSDSDPAGDRSDNDSFHDSALRRQETNGWLCPGQGIGHQGGP
jgi:hypothetical protein